MPEAATYEERKQIFANSRKIAADLITHKLATKDERLEFAETATVAQVNELSIGALEQVISEQTKTLSLEEIASDTKANAVNTVAREVSKEVTTAAIQATTDRIHDLGMAQLALHGTPYETALNETGVASGDSTFDIKKGVWVSGMFAKNTQKGDENHSGYKAKITGGTVGVDAQITENSLIGAFYSHVNSSFKFKEAKGSKLDAKSNIFGFYGNTSLTDNLSAQAIVSAGFTKINGQKKLTKKTIKSKLKNKAYSANLSLTYNKALGNNFAIMPVIGLNYSYFADGAYAETGDPLTQTKYGKKSSSNLKAILGAKLVMQKQVSDNLILMPSLKASIHQTLSENKSKVKIATVGSPDYLESDSVTEGKHSDRTTVHLGAGLLAKVNNIDLSVDYTASLRRKYVGHQGTLKMRLNF